MKLLLTFALILLSGLGVVGQASAAIIQPATEETARLRLEAFNKVWTTVNEKHYDPTFGGVDWNRIREIYFPRALQAKTDGDFHGVLRRMLGELKLSHFGIFPKDLAALTSGSAGIGIELKMLDGEPVVWRVEPGSPAETAALMPGFVIRRIGGVPVAQLLKPLEAAMTGRPISDRIKKVYSERTLETMVSGPDGSKVVIEVANATNRLQTLSLVRKPFSGEMSQPLGNFPPQQVVFESRRLADAIGYIRFNMWVMPQMPRLRTAIREMADAKGIIVDLRGNPGGIGGLASGAAGLLMDRQVSLGTMRSRGGSINFIVYPQRDPFLGKIAVLTDYATGSTSEVFAAGMQETGRAVIIGETTAGAVLPSVFDKLPTGAIFQYAISDYRSPKNILIEGRGVKPDIEVTTSRAALLAGRDPQLEAAIKYISELH